MVYPGELHLRNSSRNRCVGPKPLQRFIACPGG
jgi:hypothetical protein